MQRALLVTVMLALLAVSLAIGSLAAHWPFWSRALAWHSAAGGWPDQFPGPVIELRGAARPPVLAIAEDPRLDAPGRATQASVLLVADSAASARAFFAGGSDRQTPIDGRTLVQGLMPLLYGVLQAAGQPGLLDQPIGRQIADWAGDPRGDITPRQLLWQLSGLEGGPFTPFHPFSAQAQLASGPDFERAVLAVRQRYPAGSHFEAAAANTQALAVLATRLSGETFASQLEVRLWRHFASSGAQAMLDHRRGAMAAHCCFSAAAEDWLRVAMLLANDGLSGDRRLLPAGFAGEIAMDSPVNPGQGLIWRVVDAGTNDPLLVLESAGRLLAAAPRTGRALFWAGRGSFDAALAAQLLAAQE